VRLHVGLRLCQLLNPKLGPGGTKIEKTLIAEERQTRRKSFARGPAKVAVKQDEKDAIADYMAKHGARKVDGAASGNPITLCDWLTQVCRIPAQFAPAKNRGRGHYTVEGKLVDLSGLLAVVDRERKKRGLPALARAAA